MTRCNHRMNALIRDFVNVQCDKSDEMIRRYLKAFQKDLKFYALPVNLKLIIIEEERLEEKDRTTALPININRIDDETLYRFLKNQKWPVANKGYQLMFPQYSDNETVTPYTFFEIMTLRRKFPFSSRKQMIYGFCSDLLLSQHRDNELLICSVKKSIFAENYDLQYKRHLRVAWLIKYILHQDSTSIGNLLSTSQKTLVKMLNIFENHFYSKSAGGRTLIDRYKVYNVPHLVPKCMVTILSNINITTNNLPALPVLTKPLKNGGIHIKLRDHWTAMVNTHAAPLINHYNSTGYVFTHHGAIIPYDTLIFFRQVYNFLMKVKKEKKLNYQRSEVSL